MNGSSEPMALATGSLFPNPKLNSPDASAFGSLFLKPSLFTTSTRTSSISCRVIDSGEASRVITFHGSNLTYLLPGNRTVLSTSDQQQPQLDKMPNPDKPSNEKTTASLRARCRASQWSVSNSCSACIALAFPMSDP